MQMTMIMEEQTLVEPGSPDMPESVKAESDAPSSNLLVSGLVSATGLVSKIQALISQLSASLNSGLIEYKSHSLTYRDGAQAAMVHSPNMPGL